MLVVVVIMRYKGEEMNAKEGVRGSTRTRGGDVSQRLCCLNDTYKYILQELMILMGLSFSNRTNNLKCFIIKLCFFNVCWFQIKHSFSL